MKKKLTINDHEVKEVVINMAKDLNVDYEHENNEWCLHLPEEIGTGYVKATAFENGIGVVETDYLLKKELNFQLEKGIVHPLKIAFNRQHHFFHKLNDDKELDKIDALQVLFTSSTPTNNHIFKIPAGKPICIFSLEINRKIFEKKIESFIADMDETLVTIFRDVNGIKAHKEKNFYSLEIGSFMDEFINCELEGFMKSVYKEGKALEILTHFLKQYIDDKLDPDSRKILRQSTVEKIKESTKIIENEIQLIDNINILAKRVGLNQNTLQLGYKHMFGHSVNKYIKDLRIEKARELLETSDLNITEVTYKVGVNSRSYFSKLFKEKYGVTPTEYVKKIKNHGDTG